VLFSIEQLEAFVATVDEGSFSAAARFLGKAQSRISTAVANLELDLGITLFDRSGKYPVLSKDGERMIQTARDVLYQCRVVMERATEVSDQPQSVLRLAVDDAVPQEQVSIMLAEFAQEFRHTQIEIVRAHAGEASNLVKLDKADVAIAVSVSGLPQDDYSWEQVGSEKWYPMASATHPLAALESVSKSDLASVTQIACTSSNNNLELGTEVVSDKLWRCDDSRFMIELVCKGAGWAWCPSLQTERAVQRGELVALPVDFMETGFSGELYLCWKKDHPLRAAEKWLATRLKKAFSVR
jgi:DNA-binding transcriptional LysR family regulator